MNHINKIYRQADVYYKLSLLKTGIGPEGETAKEKSALKQIDSYNWTSPAKNLEEFERGFNIFIKVCEYLSLVPLPTGNPFSYALVGESLSKKDWTGAAFNLFAGLPYFSYISKVAGIKGELSFIAEVLRTVPGVLRPVFHKFFVWMGNSIKSVSLARVSGHATVSLLRALLMPVEEGIVIAAAKAIAMTGFTSSSVSKGPNDSNFTKTEAISYVSDYLYVIFDQQVKEIGDKVLRSIPAPD